MVTYFRYGLPPKMAAILIKPGKHEDKVYALLRTRILWLTGS